MADFKSPLGESWQDGSMPIRRVTTDLGRVVGRYVGVAVLGLVWTTMITNSTSQTDAGLLLVSATLPILIPPLVDLGTPSAVAFLTARGSYGPKEIRAYGFTVAARVGLVTTLLVLALALLTLEGIANVDPIMLVGSLSIPFAVLTNTAAGFLRGAAQFGGLVRLTASPVLLLTTGSGLILLVSDRVDPLHIAGTLALAYAATAVWSVVRYDASTTRVRTSLRREAMAYSLPLYVSEAAASVRTRSDVSLVALLLGAASAAAFGVGAMVALQLSVIAQAANIVVFPHAAAQVNSQDNAARITAFASRISVASTSAMALVLLALGPGFFASVFGDAYGLSWTVLVAYLPGTVCLSASRVLTSHLAAQGKTRQLMIMNLVAAGLAVSLITALGFAFGVVGAAVAVSATSLVGVAWRVRAFQIGASVSLRDLLLVRRTDLAEIREAVFYRPARS